MSIAGKGPNGDYASTAQWWAKRLDLPQKRVNDPIATRPVPVDLRRDPDGFRSVQLLATAAPEPMSALMDLYLGWLVGVFRGLVTVAGDTTSDRIVMSLAGVPAIRLRRLERSDTRMVYEIVGGTLARPGGTFEFLRVTDRQAAALLIGFGPRLPGWFYRWTHGRVHVSVMKHFGVMLGARR